MQGGSNSRGHAYQQHGRSNRMHVHMPSQHKRDGGRTNPSVHSMQRSSATYATYNEDAEYDYGPRGGGGSLAGSYDSDYV